MQEKRFCTDCGSPIQGNEKFCGSCGHPLSGTGQASISSNNPANQTSIPIQLSLSAGAEAITGIIPSVSRKKGLLSVEAFNIIITPKRAIFAVMTNDMIKEAAREKGKEGFFSGLMGAMTVGYTYYKKYLNMAPEASLKENPQNFEIELTNMKKVKLELGRRVRDKTRNIDHYDQSKLEIETPGEKYSFSVPHDFHNMAFDVLRKSGLS